MQLTRSEIKNYLDSAFKNTTYFKKVKGKNELEVLKSMNTSDLDFIDILKQFLSQLKLAYNKFMSNTDWTQSARQKAVLDSLVYTKNEFFSGNLNNGLKLHLCDDFYWGVYDYFEDYGNKNEVIYKEEVDAVLLTIEEFLAKL